MEQSLPPPPLSNRHPCSRQHSISTEDRLLKYPWQSSSSFHVSVKKCCHCLPRPSNMVDVVDPHEAAKKSSNNLGTSQNKQSQAQSTEVVLYQWSKLRIWRRRNVGPLASFAPDSGTKLSKARVHGQDSQCFLGIQCNSEWVGWLGNRLQAVTSRVTANRGAICAGGDDKGHNSKRSEGVSKYLGIQWSGILNVSSVLIECPS